jgi:hypothetical protein
MRFARWTFVIAGVWGIAVLTPLFFLVDVSGRPYPPPAEYPHFFYGFLLVALAWQIAFLVIGGDPVRYRWIMLPAILEKLGYVTILAVLHSSGRIAAADAQAAIPDGVLGLLFIAAFIATSPKTTVRHTLSNAAGNAKTRNS